MTKGAKPGSHGRRLPSKERILGRRLILRFSSAPDPELDRIEFFYDQHCEGAWLERETDSTEQAFKWGRTAQAFALLFLDHATAGGQQYLFASESARGLAKTVGNDRYQRFGICRRIFVLRKEAKDHECAGQILRPIGKKQPRAIQIKHTLPPDCVEVLWAAKGNQKLALNDILSLANRIRESMGLLNSERVQGVQPLETRVSGPQRSGPMFAASRISFPGRNRGFELLVGRDDELRALSLAWNRDAVGWQAIFNEHADAEAALLGEPHIPHVITFRAWGGVGKTSLVMRWAADSDNTRDIECYFDWTFYRQSVRTKENPIGATNAGPADVFLSEGLRFFKDTDFALSNTDAWKKGERLAEHFSRYRTLLILDGMEPLQDAKTGELGNRGVQALLRKLAAHNPGLCLITTRQHLTTLDPWKRGSAPEWKLEHLREEDGADLLTKLEVTGKEEKKRALSRRVKGHALTLNLLGRFLRRAHHGEIRRVDRVDFRDVNEKEEGGHAFRVVAAYEAWFKKAGFQAELAMLRLLGLFNRPATPDCLAALCEAPLAGLTDRLIELKEDDWNRAVTHLVELGLMEEHPWECPLISGYTKGQAELHIKGEKLGEPTVVPLQDRALATRYSLDSHPLVREFLAKRLQKMHAAAWKKAHACLFKHLVENVPYWPNGSDGLQPLYQAVRHGCLAGEFSAALTVFRDQIQRGGDHYSTYALGAISSDLTALAGFFERFPTDFFKGLTPREEAVILREVGYCFRGSVQLGDATKCLRKSVQISGKLCVTSTDWEEPATTAVLLSQTLLCWGDCSGAAKAAAQAVEYSAKTNDPWRRVISHTYRGDALLQGGDISGSAKAFREALRIEKLASKPLLILGNNYRYCAFLTERGQYDEAISRLETEEAHPHCGDFSKGFRAMALGRALVRRARAGDLEKAAEELKSAVALLGMAGRDDFVAGALIEQARLLAIQDDKSVATTLDEAQRIAQQGPMRLHLAEIHLLRARMCRDRKELRRAHGLISQCRYRRVKTELQDAEEAAVSWPES